MTKIRMGFTHDALLGYTRKAFIKALKRYKISEISMSSFSNIDCLMSGLAVFTFKFPSLLQFENARLQDQTLRNNLKALFSLDNVPCDTYMRERLDVLLPQVCRPVFSTLFMLLQRSKILEQFRFLENYYLISLDGTQNFSSSHVHCENCCTKHHKDGRITYHHQMLCAAVVHPDQKVVIPLCPEPIVKADGDQKNDCERNAAKRWIKDFRREHPHLNVVILADGLASNEPFVSELQSHQAHFILGCKASDHVFLSEIFEAAGPKDKTIITKKNNNTTNTYAYMRDVPLSHSKQDCRVTVVQFEETHTDKAGTEKTKCWMWVTDLPVTSENIEDFVKGARARWKIENETFNTLKNQGYEFEHNFGHGKQYLHTVFAYLMMIAFLIDQCLQHVNKRFIAAYAKFKSKKTLWSFMENTVKFVGVPNFETLYDAAVHPPPFLLSSVL